MNVQAFILLGIIANTTALYTASYTDPNGLFKVNWTDYPKLNLVEFHVNARTKGWFALGFAPNNLFHSQGDTFVAWWNSNPLHIQGYSLSPRRPAKNNKLGYVFKSLSFANGRTTMTFTRPYTAGSVTLGTGKRKVFWALYDRPWGANSRYPEHTNRGSFSATLLGTPTTPITPTTTGPAPAPTTSFPVPTADDGDGDDDGPSPTPTAPGNANIGFYSNGNEIRNLSWWVTGKDITFDVTVDTKAYGKAPGWVSIGFGASSSSFHGANTMSITCGNPRSGFICVQGQNNLGIGQQIPPQVPSQFKLIRHSTTGTELNVRFSRSIYLGAKRVNIQNANQNVFWAVAATPGQVNNQGLYNFGYHRSRGSFTANLLATKPIIQPTAPPTKLPPNRSGSIGKYVYGNGLIVIEWRALTGNIMRFTITTTSKGYISFGLSNSNLFHRNGESFTCWNQLNKPVCTLGTSSSQSLPRPQTDTYKLISASRTGGKFKVVFERPFNLANSIQLLDTQQHAFWAYSNQPGSGNSNFPQHLDRGGFSTNFLQANSTVSSSSNPDALWDPGFALLVAVLLPFVLVAFFRIARRCFGKCQSHSFTVNESTLERDSETPVTRFAREKFEHLGIMSMQMLGRRMQMVVLHH